MAAKKNYMYSVMAIFLASRESLGTVAYEPPDLAQKAALEMMGTESSSQSSHFSIHKAFPSDDASVDHNSGKSLLHSLPSEKDLEEREKWTKLGYAYWEEANLAKNAADKQKYFVEAGKAWEKVTGDKNSTRMAGDAYFKAALFSDDQKDKKTYFLMAAHIYQQTGNPLKFESALRQAKEIE